MTFRPNGGIILDRQTDRQTDRQIHIDIVVCYNNETLFSEFEKTIRERGGSGVCWKIIGVNNTENTFRSAAEAYNHALKKEVSGECIVFCHQDVLFLENSLRTIAEKCVMFPNVLWGAAGTRKAGKVISNMAVIQEGWKYGTLRADRDEKVQTLDECMIAASRELFNNFHFDELTCDGWHLYAVDMSLQCLVSGNEVMVFDANIVHLSGGNMDASFWRIEKKLAEKYRGEFSRINTTCTWTYTNPFLFYLLRLYRRVRYKIH